MTLQNWSQIATLNDGDTKRGSNIKYLPYVFTEHGVTMLAAVLKSETAVKASKAQTLSEPSGSHYRELKNEDKAV